MAEQQQSEPDPIADEIVAIKQLEPRAEQLISPPVWDYVAGGAGDEQTLADNVAAWQRIKLAPHTLVDVSTIDTSVSLFGRTFPHPIVLAPTANHLSYHADGELATLRGAREAEAIFVVSSLGSTPLQPIGSLASELNTPWWFQLYVQRDRGWTRQLVEQAVQLGATALVVTVDTPTLGARDRDKRNNLGAGSGVRYPILDGSPIRPDPTPAHRRIYNPHLSPDITWADLEWLIDISPVPVLPKGILRQDDAKRALSAGVGGLIVSNHGARNLDTAPATAEALDGVMAEVGAAVPVLVDGGLRRGTDIAKALSLGASAVLVGRPYIWGLACYGSRGVTHVVEILRTELEMAMALLGAPSIDALLPNLLWHYHSRVNI